MTAAIDLGSCYRTGQAARVLGVSSQRVRQLVEAGKLEAHQTPFGYLFDPAVIARFQRERESQKRKGGRNG